MSFGEDECRNIGESYAERNERDRKLEGLRGDCWCQCEKCGISSLGNDDNFEDNKNSFCYRCHKFYCIKCFDKHECKSENTITLTSYLNALDKQKDEFKSNINEAQHTIHENKQQIEIIKMFVGEIRTILEMDNTQKPISDVVHAIWKLEERFEKYSFLKIYNDE